jgi:salicylate hydroxylase
MLASALPPDRINLGKRFAKLTDTGGCVEAQFDTGERITVDVLVGADGIHSAVRGALFGDAEPDFAGLVAYRGLVPIERIPDPEMATASSAWVGPAAHFVHYPVSRGRLLNFVGWTEHDSWNREDWTDRAAVSRALNAFADWHADVRQIISAADTCFIWALFDRKPLPRWSVNRTTLLGDACHPMYPFMGQGAAQAIEDGAVLAECLVAASAHEASEALRRYEALRLPRVSLLQEMSRANQTLLHAPDGPAQMARDAEWAVADERFSEVMHWLYGFDAQKLELMDREAVQALLPRPR